MTNDQVRKLVVEAYAAGFAASGEGYNGEYSSKRDSLAPVGYELVPESIRAAAEKFAAEFVAASRKTR